MWLTSTCNADRFLVNTMIFLFRIVVVDMHLSASLCTCKAKTEISESSAATANTYSVIPHRRFCSEDTTTSRSMYTSSCTLRWGPSLANKHRHGQYLKNYFFEMAQEHNDCDHARHSCKIFDLYGLSYKIVDGFAHSSYNSFSIRKRQTIQLYY